MIELLKHLDVSAFRTLNLCGTNPWFDMLSQSFDILVSKGILFVLAFCLIFFTKKDKLVSITLLAGMNTAYFLNTFIKNIVQRNRPYNNIINVNIRHMMDSFSFPSGHTALAFTFAIIAAHFYKKYTMVFYFIAALIGLSRIYDGVHYPSDVIGGMILGLVTGKVLLVLTKELWTDCE
jgi:undecaprenyl-diphosphatase